MRPSTGAACPRSWPTALGAAGVTWMSDHQGAHPQHDAQARVPSRGVRRPGPVPSRGGQTSDAAAGQQRVRSGRLDGPQLDERVAGPDDGPRPRCRPPGTQESGRGAGPLSPDVLGGRSPGPGPGSESLRQRAAWSWLTCRQRRKGRTARRRPRPGSCRGAGYPGAPARSRCVPDAAPGDRPHPATAGRCACAPRGAPSR